MSEDPSFTWLGVRVRLMEGNKQNNAHDAVNFPQRAGAELGGMKLVTFGVLGANSP